jgi:hypothetical protein
MIDRTDGCTMKNSFLTAETFKDNVIAVSAFVLLIKMLRDGAGLDDPDGPVV